MKDPKVWVVLGAGGGLGLPAVKYLLAKEQLVIPIDTSEGVPDPEVLANAADRYGQIDFIINNSNYDLFNNDKTDIGQSIAATMVLLNTLEPYLRKEPAGSIINIPPQLCLAAMDNKVMAGKLLMEMDTFLTALRQEMLTLNCRLHFLEPGERLL